MRSIGAVIEYHTQGNNITKPLNFAAKHFAIKGLSKYFGNDHDTLVKLKRCDTIKQIAELLESEHNAISMLREQSEIREFEENYTRLLNLNRL